MKPKFPKAIIYSALTIFLFSCESAEKSEMNTKAAMKPHITYKSTRVGNIDIFYREAGDTTNPTILFLHGFPSSSHMYRDIMNDLSLNYHLIAPDYPGFGESDSPSTLDYTYSFDQLSVTIEHFIDKLKLDKLSLYMQDYGGPVGFRIAARRPALIQSLIIQNANAYEEGLGPAIGKLLNYSKVPTAENEKEARTILDFASTKWQYTEGASDVTKVSPDSYVSDQHYLDRPGNDQIQLALFRSYISNLKLYDSWHSYFREKKPATLVIWGKNDKIFISAGAEAFKKDNPNAEIHLLDGGHFILEERHQEAADLINDFLRKLQLKR